MIQQLRKVNILATAAMLVTFSASVALVVLITSAKTFFTKINETIELQYRDSGPSSELGFYHRTGLFRIQPDSPMQIEGFVSICWHMSCDLTIINRSNRTIQVFVLGHHSKGSRRIDNQASIDDLWNLSSALGPGATGAREIPFYFSGPYWIDFVEFSDGSTWGPNEMKSRETLDAIRAGLKEATSRFTKILQEDGPDAVTASIPKEIIIPQSHAHDGKWIRDFASAFQRVCEELQDGRREVLNQGGYSDERNAVLRGKFKTILSKFADSVNPELPSPYFPPSK